jgi:hypothetical protein
VFSSARFFKNGGVFDDDFIDSYIELKMTEPTSSELKLKLLGTLQTISLAH